MHETQLLRQTAKRLERYAVQLREKIWHGDLVGALADTAEAGEIARRLYRQLEKHHRAPLQDDPRPAEE